MAKNLTIQDEPVYNEQMEALDTTTPGHADYFNERYTQLLNNDKYLHEQLLKDGGNWSDGVSYKPMVIVRHNGASYYSVQPSSGQEPSETSEYWHLIAKDGNETVVDSELSETSTNPIQNKAVKEAIDAKGASVLIQETAPSDTSALWVW